MSRHYFTRMAACQLNKYIPPMEIVDIIQDYVEEFWHIQIGSVTKIATSHELAIMMAKEEMVNQIEKQLFNNMIAADYSHLVKFIGSHYSFKSRDEVLKLDFNQLTRWCNIYNIDCQLKLL